MAVGWPVTTGHRKRVSELETCRGRRGWMVKSWSWADLSELPRAAASGSVYIPGFLVHALRQFPAYGIGTAQTADCLMLA